MKRLYLLLIICLLCGCGTEKIKLKESVVIEFYSITSCGECKAFKKNAIPYIKKKLENQVTIRIKDLDNQKDLKDYEQIIKKLRNFDQEYYGMGPFINVKGKMAYLGYEADDEKDIINDIIALDQGNTLSSKGKGHRYMYQKKS